MASNTSKTNTGFDITYIGMALVDSIIKGFDPNPVSASGFRADSGFLNVGGEAVNGSMATAKLGMKTSIFCALGKDTAGDMIVDALKSTGVDCRNIIRLEEYSTPVTTMFVNEDGSRKSITNTAHRQNFHPEKYEECFINSRAIILGSLFRAPFDDKEIIHRVLSKAHDAGVLIFADTKLPNFNFLELYDIRDSLPLIDYITPNEDEARYYSGKEDIEDMADSFLSMGVKNVIIKLGAKGCFFKNEKESIRLNALPIKAADATGAGDNFLAGFASEILCNATNKEALLFANTCGAICTTAVGAGSGLKDKKQVEEWKIRWKNTL